MKKTERDSNIELLRIVLMLMIVFHHLIVHGYGLSSKVIGQSSLSENTLVMLLVNSFIIIAVNTYIFISAYYGIKFSVKNLISFIVQASFYSVILYSVFCYMNLDQWTMPSLFRSFIPILSGKWWFLSGYILLFILSPILNSGIDTLTKNQLRFVMIGLIVISASIYITNFYPDSYRVNISTIGLFLTIYVCGRYFRKFPVQIKKPFLYYILFSLTVFFTLIICHRYLSADSAWDIFGYVNPLIIAASICFFYTFKRIKIKSAFINSVSTLTFGVYLIHDADGMRRFLSEYMNTIAGQYNNVGVLLLIALTAAISIFVICCCIEKVRQIVFTPLVNTIADSGFVKKLKL